MAELFKSGYVSLIGLPNVGKSTLLNALIKQKLAIVSAKPQTTRQQVLGILSSDTYQIVFLDTPGLLKPKYQLQNYMSAQFFSSIQDASIILVVVDGRSVNTMPDKDRLKNVFNLKKDVFLIINKIDTIAKSKLLPMIDYYNNNFSFSEIIPLSALKHDGIDVLLQLLVNALPKGEPFYPPDYIAGQPELFFVSEFIRETVIEQTQQEIPYSTAVLVEPFKRRGKKCYIKAEIYVERDTQRMILLGKKGSKLREIGAFSRAKIEEFLDEGVFLDIWVKVKQDWKDDKKALADLGYK